MALLWVTQVAGTGILPLVRGCGQRTRYARLSVLDHWGRQMRLRSTLATVGRNVLGTACALTFALGIFNPAFAQQRPLGAMGDGYWTVLTMSPDGSWGTATEIQTNLAIANAISRCKVMSRAELGCGAHFVAIQHGWSLGFRCGSENILVAAPTLGEAERTALTRESELRRLYVPEMPPCQRAVAVNQRGAIVTPTGRDFSIN